MTFVAGHKVIRSGRISAFDKDVVCRVGCNLRQVRRNDNPTMILNQLQKLLPKALPNLELGPR
jgi:hypothetical protein